MSLNIQLNKKLENYLPYHIAIIMDGNGRWARNRGKINILGHKKGVIALKRAVIFAVKNKIQILTLYAFSKENWNRPKKEVKNLINLFSLVLNDVLNKLNKFNIKLKIIGDISKFNFYLRKKIKYAEKFTKNNNGLILNIAVNYSGKWDIINAFKKIIKKFEEGHILLNQIKEDTITQNLCLSKLKPVDLVIRTGGEHRISNFLLWQIAYSEFYFTDVLWPDFNGKIFKKAIKNFLNRKRRFGV